MPKKARNTFKHKTIAIIYDFDGTLSPLPMQEYTVLPEIGIRGKRFWEEVREENTRISGEGMITYMMKMLELANSKKIPITRRNLGRLSNRIRYFPGVERYFPRINRYVRRISSNRVQVRHYVISAGLREILEKASIRKYFKQIYASEYFFDHYGAAQFPKLVVTDTVKTQFLFRINKGREKISENVNEHMPAHLRAIPFSNILYIGDGLSDVPCMTVTTKNGGYAVAVYKNGKGLTECKNLWRARRVDFIAKADYRQGSALDKTIKVVLDAMTKGIFFQETAFKQFVKLKV